MTTEWNPERPDYYRSPRFDIVDVITDFRMDFPTGCAVKYLTRAGKKPGNSELQDLLKAQECLRFLIGRAQRGAEAPEPPPFRAK